MKTENFHVPSLTAVLEERNFPITGKSLKTIQKVDDSILKIFQELHHKEMIFFVKKCQPINIKEIFMVLYKVFYAETKYFKIFFKFSSQGEFLGISLNDPDASVSFSVLLNHLEDLLTNEIENGYSGIKIENDYLRFLPLFTANNSCCLGFKNLTCNPDRDRIGIDFEIEFKQGLMLLQLKGIKNLTHQHRIAVRHFKSYSDISLMFTFPGERYRDRRRRLLQLWSDYLSKTYPFVSYVMKKY